MLRINRSTRTMNDKIQKDWTEKVIIVVIYLSRGSWLQSALIFFWSHICRAVRSYESMYVEMWGRCVSWRSISLSFSLYFLMWCSWKLFFSRIHVVLSEKRLRERVSEWAKKYQGKCIPEMIWKHQFNLTFYYSSSSTAGLLGFKCSRQSVSQPARTKSFAQMVSTEKEPEEKIKLLISILYTKFHM